MPNIRLINLSTSKIETTNPGEAPPYLAISHAWSDQLFPAGTPVAGSTGGVAVLKVVAELHHDIEHCWIDNFCILQDSEEDKLDQIPLMGGIYRNARAVVVILPCDIGFAQGTVDEATDGLKRALDVWRDETWDEDEEIRLWKNGEGRAKLVNAMKGMSRLTRSAWATRIWTLQEFILARAVAWIGRDLRPVTFNARFFQAIPGLCDQFEILECSDRDPASEFFVLHAFFSGMANCHLGDVDRTRVMELLGNRRATVPVDEVYGAMAASGVEITPVAGELRETAWERWCEEAVSRGKIRWMMLPQLLPASTGKPDDEPQGGLGKPNCAFPSFSVRHMASSLSYLDNVEPFSDVTSRNGTIHLTGRALGKCTLVRRLGSVHQCAQGRFHRDITTVLFAGGRWRTATDTAVALAAGRYNRRELLALAQILVQNHKRALFAVSRGREMKFRPKRRGKLQDRVWKDFMQLMSLSILDMLDKSVGYLARIDVPLLGLEVNTVVVLGARVPSGPLSVVDFNAVTGTRRHIFMIVEESGATAEAKDGDVCMVLHKAGITIPIAEEIRYMLDTIPLRPFAIGGRQCLVCNNS